MKRPSFRLRIALLSVLTSGFVLAAFAFLFFSTIRRIAIERIDRELQALGDAQVRGPRPPEHWARFDDSLASIYGEAKRTQFLVKVNDRDHRSLYVSPHWPANLQAADLGITEIQGPRPEPGFEPPPFARPPPNAPPLPPLMHMTAPRWQTLAADGLAWRFVIMGNERVTLALGMSLADFYREIRRLRNRVAVAVPLALLVLTAGGWWLAGQALHPVKTLTKMAGAITVRDLNQRVQTADADAEFQALIDVINGMLDRLEKSFQQAIRFSADAAHELKTPLTILQGHLQQAIQNVPEASAEQRRYADFLEEVQRLKTIVRKLLLLAQADSGQIRLSRERVNLSRNVQEICEDAQQMATGLRITSDIAAEIFVMADPDLLRQVLQNLTGNAIKYNREAGTVEVRLHRQDQRAILSITNTTHPEIPIAPDHLFERFYRGDAARSRKIDGVGLGLSLAREIARAHQGDVTVGDLQPDVVTFIMTLPASI